MGEPCVQQNHSPKPQGTSGLANHWPTLTLAIVTAFVLCFTLFFAYNSSLDNPLLARLVFDKPQRSILLLNIASQWSMFCLGSLTSNIFNTIRWTFAFSALGTPAHTFIGLSSATNILGVLCLLFDKKRGQWNFQKDGPKLWAGIR